MDLVGVKEIGDMLGVTRQRADQLTRREGFPEPLGEVAAGRIWRRADIEAWARSAGRLRAETAGETTRRSDPGA